MNSRSSPPLGSRWSSAFCVTPSMALRKRLTGRIVSAASSQAPSALSANASGITSVRALRKAPCNSPFNSTRSAATKLRPSGAACSAARQDAPDASKEASAQLPAAPGRSCGVAERQSRLSMASPAGQYSDCRPLCPSRGSKRSISCCAWLRRSLPNMSACRRWKSSPGLGGISNRRASMQSRSSRRPTSKLRMRDQPRPTTGSNTQPTIRVALTKSRVRKEIVMLSPRA